MNRFDLLVVLNAIVALAALHRLRLCIFIFCCNNLLVSRALGSIGRYGTPASQWFIPSAVFSEENQATAGWILAIAVAASLASMLVAFRRRVRIGPEAPCVPTWLLVLSGLYLLAFIGSTKTILAGEYMTEDNIRYDLELAGGHAFICSIVLYELVRRRLVGTITSWRAFLILVVSLGLPHYLKGATGITTGFLTAGALTLLPRTGSEKRIRNTLLIATSLLIVLAVSSMVRGIRTTFFVQGTDAISGFVDNTFRMEGDRSDLGEGAESIANASQSATHLLACIALYDSGISRDWRSIYDVVEYTFVPSFFVRYLGWTRSIDPPTELRDYYPHGGGINLLGEFYWNGGWLCVVIMIVALVAFCSIADLRYRSSPFWLMLTVQFAPSFLMGYGYGFSQISRGAINGLLAAGFYGIFVMVRRATRSSNVHDPVPG